MMWDVIVVGAGVTGCAVARELSRFQANILVLEKEEDVCCGTSKANSAIVHAGFDAANGSLKAKLNVLGSRMMPALARDLDISYVQNGSLVVMLREEDWPRLHALYENGVKNGVEGLQILEADALRAMEPNISDDAVAALYAPTGGIICPFGLTYALAENAAANGVEFRFNEKVTDLAASEQGWCVTTDAGTYSARVVINAAGVAADTLHNLVCEEKIKIIPRRGEYFLLDKTTGGFVSKTIFQLPGVMGKGVLVSPTVHGNTLVGPTASDQTDKENRATTAEGLADLREKCNLAVKDLPLRQTITSFAGLRAHEEQGEFVLGETAPGFIDCAGIESPGLSCAPALGVYISELVEKKLSLKRKTAFLSTRKGIVNPAHLSREEYAELIRREPAYGTVVCRCETITEGEILDAIHRVPGAKSVDGVKRRTRAGMGRCQGGFCSPRVMELLARELGVPQEQVTKAGGASRYIVGSNKDSV